MSGAVVPKQYTFASLAEELGPNSGMTSYMQITKNARYIDFALALIFNIVLLATLILMNQFSEVGKTDWVGISIACVMGGASLLHIIMGLKESYDYHKLNTRLLEAHEIEHYKGDKRADG